MTVQNTGKCNISTYGIEKNSLKSYDDDNCKFCDNIDKPCQNDLLGKEHMNQFNYCYKCPNYYSKCNISNLNPEINSICKQECVDVCSSLDPYTVINNCSKCLDNNIYKCNNNTSEEYKNNKINLYNKLYCDSLKNLK